MESGSVHFDAQVRFGLERARVKTWRGRQLEPARGSTLGEGQP